VKNNVYSASKERIVNTFLSHTRSYLALSGGKDSGVMLHLVVEEAKKLGIKIGVLVVDTEAQYTLTDNFLKEIINEHSEYIELFWVCLPLKLDNTISSFSNDWICWDEDKKSCWIREQNENAITDYKYFDFYRYGMCFYDFIKKFAEWYSNGQKTACFVGIRAYESKTRMNIFNNKNEYLFKNTKNTNNSYPIFDWKFEDIWHYNYKFNKSYNAIYDLMYSAGVSFKMMRVGQLFGNEQKRSLSITRVIDHKIWVKMLYRVNGVDFTSRVSSDGYIMNISKPNGRSWEEFALFICDTLPKQTKSITIQNIKNIVKLWATRGYYNGIPDEAPICLENERKVPSWRRICKSLLKNDFSMGGFGAYTKEAKLYKNYIDRRMDNIKYGSLF
jgi:predicted phosphoadenosine phosphosulfate sulfurtransferase